MEDTTEKVIKTAEDSDTEKLVKFTEQGIELIKNKDYEPALSHFDNGNFAKSLGIDFGDSKVLYLHHDLRNPEDCERVLDFVSLHSHFIHSPPELKLAVLTNFNPIKDGEKYFVPNEVWRDIALVYLEEWLHAIQFVSHKPLTGEDDKEFDVAIYMKRKGIELTKHFLQMEGRSRFFKEHPDL